MEDKELKALVSLLDDDDAGIASHVEEKILSLGNHIIPLLETEWESSFNPVIQKKIEEIIHTLQFDNLKSSLITWKENGGEDLLEGMWLVATYMYPDIELVSLRQELEQIYQEAWREFRPNIHPYDQVKVLNNALFSTYKFSANTKSFHSPANSMINVVLQTKKGNPISLCVIYMIIARRLELPVYGVNLPNLFICTYKSPEHQFYINAFNRGLIFTRKDIEQYVSHLQIAPKDLFFDPCSNIEIIKRVLRNLTVSFEKLGEYYRVDEIKTLLNGISSPEDDHDILN